MLAFHSDQHEPVLPPGHRFPMAKYRLLRERVAAALPRVRLQPSPACDEADLMRVHEAGYVAAVTQGTLDAAHQREIGFPWSASLVERSRRSVGGTVAALRHAVKAGEGVAVNLAGGTHHASRSQGSGFCVFNDVAVAAEVALQAGWARRVAVIDLDVHQGNGTAAIFTGDERVFTLSLHGERNFPFRKVPGCLDVGLPDGCDGPAYLLALDEALQALSQSHRLRAFDLVFYLAGADPHEGDRLGHLRLSAQAMRLRDERVMRLAESWQSPLVMCMAGGYGRDLDAMLAVQLASVGEALSSWQRRRLADLTAPTSADLP
ncbi:MAG: histone deacetylase [Burkholderiales bacterium]|nr:histone deacetylase [Burkholderiales bacterium]MBH2015929.1 histone deacetylase [Burkholderiales bacterium]